jgi:DMSO reductase anchor subunit
MIATSGLLGLLVQLVIGGLIFYVLWWTLGKIAPPEPINKVCMVVLVLACVIWLISLLLGLGGHPLFR